MWTIEIKLELFMKSYLLMVHRLKIEAYCTDKNNNTVPIVKHGSGSVLFCFARPGTGGGSNLCSIKWNLRNIKTFWDQMLPGVRKLYFRAPPTSKPVCNIECLPQILQNLCKVWVLLLYFFTFHLGSPSGSELQPQHRLHQYSIERSGRSHPALSNKISVLSFWLNTTLSKLLSSFITLGCCGWTTVTLIPHQLLKTRGSDVSHCFALIKMRVQRFCELFHDVDRIICRHSGSLCFSSEHSRMIFSTNCVSVSRHQRCCLSCSFMEQCVNDSLRLARH